MAELATYIGVQPRTGVVGASAIQRGLRVLYGATGLLTVAGAAVRGDYVTLVDGAIGETVAVAPLSSDGKVPMQAALAVAMGDPAYGAAGGQVTNLSAGAAVIGKFTQPASGAGILTEVELESVI